MKKLLFISSLIAFLCIWHAGTILAAGPTPLSPALGGWGISTTTPANVGNCAYVVSVNVSGVPTYGFTTCGSGSNSSGTIIFLANGQAFITSSTVNFQAGANVTITTSTNGTYTIAASAPGGSGVATTTINGTPSTTFYLIGDGTTISSTVIGATTTFRSLVTSSSLGVFTNLNQYPNGNNFLGVNSTTLYVVSVNGAAGTVTITSSSLAVATNTLSLFNGNGFITGAPATTTITASGTTVTGPSFTYGTTTAIQPYVSGSLFYWAFVNPGFVTLASSSFVTTTTQITSGGTATGNSFTLATSTAATTFNINCATATCTLTIPNSTAYFVNGAGFLANGSTTANAPITWSASNVIGWNGPATSTMALTGGISVTSSTQAAFWQTDASSTLTPTSSLSMVKSTGALNASGTLTIASGTYINGALNVSSTASLQATTTILGNTSIGTTTFKSSSTAFQVVSAAGALTASSAVSVFIGDASSSRPGCLVMAAYPTGTVWQYMWFAPSGTVFSIVGPTSTPCS